MRVVVKNSEHVIYAWLIFQLCGPLGEALKVVAFNYVGLLFVET